MIRVISLIFTAFFAWSCENGSANTDTSAEGQPADTTRVIQATTVPVSVTKAERKVFEHQIVGRGKLQAVRSTGPAFQMGGTLAKLTVKNGDFVEKGQLIAQLDQQQAKISLKQAENEVLVKQDDYKLLLKEFQMVQGDTNQRNEAQKRSMLARSGLMAARIDLEQAQLDLSKTELYAPFSGIISGLEKMEGEQVAAGEAFCQLHYPNMLSVDVPVLETDLSLLREGLPATVEVLAYPNRTFQGKVQHIAPMVGQDNQVQVTVLLQLPNRHHPLLPGMNASVTLKIPVGESLVVPKEAVVIRSGRAVVFRLEDGLAKWHYVETGKQNTTEVQILEGLEGEPTVIISNNLQLSHDAPVQPEEG